MAWGNGERHNIVRQWERYSTDCEEVWELTIDSLVCAEDTLRKLGKQSQVGPGAHNIHAKLKINIDYTQGKQHALHKLMKGTQ